MKCSEAEQWLLTTRADEELPAPVAAHVEKCTRCRDVRRRLDRLDAAAQGMPLPPPRSDARRQLERRLEAAAPTPLTPAARPRRWPLGRVLGWTAAACVFLGLGWLLARLQETTQGVSAEDLALLVRVSQHAAALAETDSADAEALLGPLQTLAGDLEQESIRRVRRQVPEDIQLLGALYERVLRQGLVPRAAAVPAGKRASVARALAQHVNQGAAELGAASQDVVPALADMLQSMQATARECAGLLEAAATTPASAAPARPEPVPLLASLVLGSIRLSNEKDPLRGAGQCAELAGVVVRATVLAALGGHVETAGALSESFARLVQQALTRAERIERDDHARARRDEIAGVRIELARAVDRLEKNAAQAPRAAGPALRQALASAAGAVERVHATGVLPDFNPSSTPENVREGK